jgi:hypothetical protein
MHVWWWRRLTISRYITISILLQFKQGGIIIKSVRCGGSIMYDHLVDVGCM